MNISPKRIAGIVLAAGRSQRMGSPKATLNLYGRPLLEHHVEALAAVVNGPVAIVLGHNAHQLRMQLELSKALVIVNPEYQHGQFTSVRAGLSALLDPSLWLDPSLPSHTDGTFLTPVDCPPVPEATLRRMLQTFVTSDSHDAIIPTHRGKPGHPVLLGRSAMKQALAADPSSNLKRALESPSLGVLRLELADPAILWNLNTPEDLATYLARNPHPPFYSPSTGT